MGERVETLADLEGIPIYDNGEPLVDLRHACPGVLVGEQPLYARQGVAVRLNVVQDWLGTHYSGYRLCIGDAYRSPAHQARLFRCALVVARLLHPFRSAAQVREAANRYVAAPDAVAPAPHTTGGAIDVGLMAPDGRRAYMGPFLPAATCTDYPRLNALAKRHRAILCAAMQQGEFSNYPLEWWHWSYGDSGWAWRTKAPVALYGAAEMPPQ